MGSTHDNPINCQPCKEFGKGHIICTWCPWCTNKYASNSKETKAQNKLAFVVHVLEEHIRTEHTALEEVNTNHSGRRSSAPWARLTKRKREHLKRFNRTTIFPKFSLHFLHLFQDPHEAYLPHHHHHHQKQKKRKEKGKRKWKKIWYLPRLCFSCLWRTKHWNFSVMSSIPWLHSFSMSSLRTLALAIPSSWFLSSVSLSSQIFL